MTTSTASPSITRPIDERFLRGIDDIPLVGNFTDDGGCGEVSGGDVDFYVVDQSYYTWAATDVGDGNYTCTILSSQTGSWTYGWHQLKMNGTRNYYTVSEINITESFYLADAPDLSLPEVSPASDVWGTNFTFNVSLQDEDPDNVTVKLWIKRPNQDWELEDSYLQEGVTSGTVNVGFVVETDCGDVGTDEYKFNTTDTSGYTDEINGGSFTIQEHGSLLIIQSGSDENVSREGIEDILFSVRVRDQTTGTYVQTGVNGTFWIENKTMNQTLNLETNGTGHLVHLFDPDCTHNYGEMLWKVGVNNDACYVDSNTTAQTITVLGQLKNNFCIIKVRSYSTIELFQSPKMKMDIRP